ncbi:MAG: hypothetical protein E4G96_00995 [Chrysiogenales bacterium]|nr:MAG: hypothetical protein E4G96_00995 [Chrysiogenales bacterium]
MAQIDILSSIYSGYNTIDGAEYVLRLKALLESYRKRYTREGLDFNLVHRLIHSIAEARDNSFDGFPGLSHSDAPAVVDGFDTQEGELSLRKFKWITFERNRSWFIARFRSIDIIREPVFSLVRIEEPDCMHVEIAGSIVRIRDIFTRSLDSPKSPRHLILLDGGERSYAANRIGKRLFADRDFLMPLVRPFKKVEHTTLSPGRVRLFGKNHLLLY